MRKFLLLFGILLLACSASYAAKIPDEVAEYINKTVPGTDIRFDGVVILPDNTIYLPLFPSLFSDIKVLKVKESYPANRGLAQRADVIIFNNDFVLMKVLSDGEGHRTVMHMSDPPLQVRTGLLPQDMLVPSGLIVPENLKGIIGNLKIDTKNEDVIKQTLKENFEEFLDESDNAVSQTLVPQLKNKTVFITTNYSKNIQVMEPAQRAPKYSLAQKSIPVDVKAVEGGRFLLVTSYERPFLDVVSVADSRFIKQINLAVFPEEILVDQASNKAYVTAPAVSTIFVIDLNTMSLIQRIRVNGYCEKLILAGDKLFYVDKLKNEIWAVETGNEYTLRNIGRFPNVSAIVYSDGKVYISSRTKSRIAVVDYSTLGLISEITTENKPVAMQIFNNFLYVLSAQNNIVQKFDLVSGKALEILSLNTGGFSKGFKPVAGTEMAVITDVKNNIYTLFDMAKGRVIKSYEVSVPIKDVVITDKVRLFD